MRLLTAAVVLLAVAVAGLGVAFYLDDGSSAKGDTTTYDIGLVGQAAANEVTPAVMEERLKWADRNCEIFKYVDARYTYLTTTCRLNVESGQPWYDGMPPRQIRAVAEALIEANR